MRMLPLSSDKLQPLTGKFRWRLHRCWDSDLELAAPLVKCYEPKEWGSLRYINYAILRSTKYGYLQERDQVVLAFDYLSLTKGIKV